ncbi:MAG TPA: glutaredoxin family protein [Gaiella sp.]|uniref:glutaredoxin family protein n=1 Tax=Gaiella sp. TaxID=2663207 RepID=UPI002D7FDA27|nr:glutaredoxin family protein [Gaiella sp.]HET9287202.1 glutaredoxin family protein [Gaiella sp.]
MPRVVLFVAQGCHLCEAALDVVVSVCGDAHAVVDITGDTALEKQYRGRIPVVEVDGIERFTYFVTPEALRAAIA